MNVRFVEQNPLSVLDHQVTLPSGVRDDLARIKEVAEAMAMETAR